ncbi:MAG: TonB-dependent receptor [Bryobacterales bacterium]|nr:TonB-dependent receptor [Bryobacterales bacterium]
MIERAAIRISSATGADQRLAITGSDGRFRFDNVRAGSLILTVDADAFERFVRPVTLNGRDNTEVAVTLAIRALPQQVSVTASNYIQDLDDSARAASVLGRMELDRRMEFSVAEALREIPGVRITQVGGPGQSTNIRIRGLRAQDTALLIDGMRLRDPAATQSDASAVTAELLTLNIARLEVLRGCGSAMYGTNAMGGVVNVISDAGGGSLRGDLLTEGGGLGFIRSQARMSGGIAQDRLMYSLGLGHINVMEGVDGDDRARNSSGQGFVQYRLRPVFLLSARVSATNSFLGLNASPALTANAPRTGTVTAIPLSNLDADRRQQGQPFSLGNATVFQAPNDPDSRRSTWLTSALFAADHQLTPKLHYRLAYQLVDVRRSFPNGPAGIGFQPRFWEVSNFDGRIDTMQARWNYSGLRHILSGGYEFEREAFDNSGASRVQPGIGTGTETFNRARVSQLSNALFVEDRLRLLGSKLQVTLSGRAQTFNLRAPVLTGGTPAYLGAPVPNPPNAFTGDAAVMYRFEKSNTKLRAHVGNAYRAPSLYERYGTGFFGGSFAPYGDPRLTPERSVGGDAGIDQYIAGRRARISATYFYTQLETVIGFDFTGIVNRTTDPFGRGSGYFNTNGGLARGVELETQAALWRGFQVTGAYTHTRTLERRAVALGTLLTPRIFAHTVTLNASQTWRRWTATMNFLGAPEFIGVISGRAVAWEGPKRLDTVVSYRLPLAERLRSELFWRAENLLAQRYFEDGFRTPGRWMLAGLRLSF